MVDWRTSFSEDEQRNKQRGHETDQQFHHSLLERGLAGWLNVTWLAGGEAVTTIYTWQGWRPVTIGLNTARQSDCVVIAVTRQRFAVVNTRRIPFDLERAYAALRS